MTQAQLILAELTKSTRGLTANELFERLGIARNTLATLIWELKRDGLIERVGGPRGRYRYGITDVGRAELESGGDPLTRLGQLAHGSNHSLGALTAVVRDLDNYKNLIRFVDWLIRNKSELLRDSGSEVEAELYDAVLTYLGVDATSFRQQRERAWRLYCHSLGGETCKAMSPNHPFPSCATPSSFSLPLCSSTN